MLTLRPWLFSVALLSGCASQYKVPPSAPTANLTITASDVEGGSTTSKQAIIFAIPNGSCGEGTQGEFVSREFKMGTPSNISTEPAKIAAGGQFSFIAKYMDTKYALNRECSIQASFRPQPGKSYRGVILVQGQVEACNFVLHDISNDKADIAEFEMPPMVCPFQGKLAIPNGKASRLHWQIQTIPAK